MRLHLWIVRQVCGSDSRILVILSRERVLEQVRIAELVLDIV